MGVKIDVLSDCIDRQNCETHGIAGNGWNVVDGCFTGGTGDGRWYVVGGLSWFLWDLISSLRSLILGLKEKRLRGKKKHTHPGRHVD